MKKIILTLVFASAMTTLSAQTETPKPTEEGYNKWSIELAGGVNKPQSPMTVGHSTSTPSPYVVDLGARYMFNNKFGLKADFGFNSLTGGKNSIDFDTKYYRADIQGVANLGRIMNFETWTQRIGLLGHAGFGLSMLERKDPSYVKDRMGNFIAGITGQIKLTERVALTADFTTISNASQNVGFDGASPSYGRGFTGTIYNGTIGVTVYLGKNSKHADWVSDEDKFKVVDNRLTSIETNMIDTDNDGVADYLDQEPNTVAGAMVDTKGRSTDLNNNKVPDEMESYLLANYGSKTDDSPFLTNEELVKNLINGGYVCTYFDFDKSEPTNDSTESIAFILTYLRNNPNASVDIIGHADELGQSDYNDKLSGKRADNVKKLLVKANVDASRLNVIANGEDNSVDKNSKDARKLVRKVTFSVK